MGNCRRGTIGRCRAADRRLGLTLSDVRDSTKSVPDELTPITLANQPPGTAIWLASLDDIAELGDPATILPASEWSHASSLRQPGDRARFIAGRVLLRHALTRAVDGDVQPSAWRFRLNENDKPLMDNGFLPIPFNLSHVGSCAAVVIGKDHPVGIDIESLAPEDRGDIALDALSERERARLDRVEEDRRATEFIRLWTVKEAVAKALGLGVSIDFREITVELDPLRADVPAELTGIGRAKLNVASAAVRCDGGHPFSLSVAVVVGSP